MFSSHIFSVEVISWRTHSHEDRVRFWTMGALSGDVVFCAGMRACLFYLRSGLRDAPRRLPRARGAAAAAREGAPLPLPAARRRQEAQARATGDAATAAGEETDEVRRC